MRTFKDQAHVLFMLRYLRATNSRGARVKVFCSVNTKTGTYAYDGDYADIIGRYLAQNPLKYYKVNEATLKRINNPSNTDDIIIGEMGDK